MAASELMISMVSELFVMRARDRGRRVRVIWPEGAARD